MLQLTYKELEQIVNEEVARFEVLYNDIPKVGHSSDYIEDDGRQYRYFEFKDTQTKTIYSFSYVWNVDFDYKFPLSFLGDPPAGIDFIETSTITPPVPPEPVPELTAEESIDADMWAVYHETNVMGFDPKKNMCPVSVIDDLLKFLNTKQFSVTQLRRKIIPVCVEYKIEQKSLWKYLQRTRGAWK